MKIVFATNNPHKLQEIRDILGDKFQVVGLAEIGCHDDIPETGKTLEENARQKAEYVFNHFHTPCFADDTGLEVDALGGAPGVHSARYAEGTDHDSEANMEKLLRQLAEEDNRKARFRTVIDFIYVPQGAATPAEVFFDGTVEGRIGTEKRGAQGFGYDPLFIPGGFDKTFAELGEDVKNSISHRARAVKKLVTWLNENMAGK